MTIERGCLAVVTSNGNFGKSVIVGEYLGVIQGFKGRNIWEICVRLKGVIYSKCFYLDESELMRIDGDVISMDRSAIDAAI